MLRTACLIGQSGGAQSLDEGYCEFGDGADRCALSAAAEVGLENKNPLGRYLRLFDTPELHKRRREHRMGNTETRLAPDGAARGCCRLLVASAQEIPQEHPVQPSGDPGIEWAEAQSALAPFDGLLSLTAPAQYQRSPKVRPCCRRGNR